MRNYGSSSGKDLRSSASPTRIARLRKFLRGIRGLVFWGGLTGTEWGTLKLCFGDKVPRPFPLKNTHLSRDYRIFEGTYNLLVWCRWRLARRGRPTSSAEVPMPYREEAVKSLIGNSVTSVRLNSKSLDLVLEMSDGSELSVFCMHLGRHAAFSSNWEIVRNRVRYVIDSKPSICMVEDAY